MRCLLNRARLGNHDWGGARCLNLLRRLCRKWNLSRTNPWLASANESARGTVPRKTRPVKCSVQGPYPELAERWGQ